MRKTLIGLAFLLLAAIAAPSPALAMRRNVDVVLFHGQGCMHCARTITLLDEMMQEHPEIVLHEFEVYFNPENAEKMMAYAEAYGKEVAGVPTLFVGNTVIEGHQPEKLTATIEECLQKGCESPIDRVEGGGERIEPIPEPEPKPEPGTTDPVTDPPDSTIETPPEGEPQPETPARSLALQKLTIPAVISAAAVDAINPCAFAVLIILLSAVLGSGSRRRSLLAGLAFAAAVFMSYFAMGLGLYSAAATVGISRSFYVVIAVLAIVLGLFNLKDYLWYGKWFVMEVPPSWRPKMKSIISGVTSVPGAFGVGFVVSLFLLPCTSGPYIVILGLLAKAATRAQAIPLLALYNAIFVAPMVLISFAIYFGMTTTKQAEDWRRGKLRVLHLIAGVIILGLGLIMLGSVLTGHV